jgi:DNA-directed RNA polymerase subunit RPC12/RpoP
MVSPPGEELEKRVDEFLTRSDLPPYRIVRVDSAYEQVKIAEKSGRYADAAQAYETLGVELGDEKLLDKARMLRAKAHDTGQTKIVSVDVNELIRQLKQGGLVVAYRCPNCGGNLKISGDTKPESLKFCSYCGSKIEAVDIADFLRSVF